MNDELFDPIIEFATQEKGIYATGEYVTILLVLDVETKQVQRFICDEFAFAEHDVLPPGRHPLILTAGHQKGVKNAQVNVPVMDYLEFGLVVPFLRLQEDTKANPEVFAYTARFFLDDWLPILIGWGYGFPKRHAKMEYSKGAYAVRDKDDKPILDFSYKPEGSYEPAASNTNFARHMAKLVTQTLVGQTFTKRFLASRMEWDLNVSKLRPIAGYLDIHREFLPGLPVGRHVFESLHDSVLGAFEWKAPWRLGLPQTIGPAPAIEEATPWAATPVFNLTTGFPRESIGRGAIAGTVPEPAVYEAALARSLNLAPDELGELPWIMSQDWTRSLFIHWETSIDTLRARVPDWLEIDTFQGKAYLTLIPFRMERLHLRGMPPLPYLSEFSEMNFRTYVKAGEHRGVYFFSIDADAPLGISIARIAFNLPFVEADCTFSEKNTSIWLRLRREAQLRLDEARFAARWRPSGEPRNPAAGSLDAFLTDRATMFSENAFGQPLWAKLQHAPWKLQNVEVEIQENTIPESAGLKGPDETAFYHYAHHMRTLLFPPTLYLVS